MNILIADDHALLRRGIAQLLRESFPSAEVSEAANGNQVIDLVSEKKWDLLILDLSMPGANGLDVLRDLKELAPELPTLVLTMHPEDQFGVLVMKSGARGYLSKEAAPEELAKAAQTALDGGRYVSAQLATLLEAAKGDTEQKAGAIPLSQREAAVMKMLYEGHAVKEIGARLELNPKTISTYRHRILAKLGVSSNAELVQYIIKHRLIQ